MSSAAPRDDHRRPSELIARDVDDQVASHETDMFIVPYEIKEEDESALPIFFKPQGEKARHELACAGGKLREGAGQGATILFIDPAAQPMRQLFDFAITDHFRRSRIEDVSRWGRTVEG